MTAWSASLPPALQTTLIAGVTAAIVAGLFSIFATVLKDFLAPFLVRRLESRKSSEDVFRRYAEPLAAASINLFWRLKETLAKDGRGYYLSAVEPRSEFETYKLISTYYRVASILGCIRALQRELLYFRVEQKRVSSLELSLREFETSLADGHEVELQRLRGLLALWHTNLRNQSDEVHVAVDLERVKRVWMSQRTESLGEQLNKKDQRLLLKEIVAQLDRYINTPVDVGLQDETLAQAMRWLFIKQAWLYRDWQSAIGDMMIKEAHAGNRSFEIIGFKDFEKIVCDPDEEQYRILIRIAAIFDGLQIDREDPFDARGVMVRKIYIATAKLIVALSSTKYSKYLIPDATLKEVLDLTYPSPTSQ